MLTSPCRETNAVDEGEAQEGNDPEPAKPQWMPMPRGVRVLTGRLWGEADVAGK